MDSIVSSTKQIQVKKVAVQDLNQKIAKVEKKISKISPRSPIRKKLVKKKKNMVQKKKSLVSQIQNLKDMKLHSKAKIDQITVRTPKVQQKIMMAKQEKKMVMQQAPTLGVLKQRLQKLKVFEADAQQIEDMLSQKLANKKEKVLMCKTYNIKYPTVLKLAKRIADAGCYNYQFVDFLNKQKADAQEEVYDAICSN